MKILFMSQQDAETLVPNKDVAIISIVGIQSPPRRLKGWTNRLDLHFDDIVQPTPGYKSFTPIDAQRIKSFVKHLPSNVKTIVVHCLHGASRSAGVAKWLNEVYKTNEFPIFYSAYNPLVYKLLKD